MAQKKGLIYRLTMGKDNLPDFTPDKLPGTRWALFKDVFFNRFGALVKVNLLTLLFCLPAIAWVVFISLMKNVDGTIVPYSGNIGLGYPAVPNAAAIGMQRAFSFNMQMYLILIPLIMIAGIGLAGAFYVIKRLAWGEGIGVASHFFTGIKMNFLPFLWSSLFCGLSLFFVMFNLGVYDQMIIGTVWKVIGISVSLIQFVLLMCMMIFLTTQAVTYKLKTWGLIKNSFLFAIALIPQNLIFLILSAIPILIVLLLPSFLSMFAILIFALFGLSYIILVWTIYAHWAFDKFINERVEGAVKDKGLYRKTADDEKAKEERNKKTNNIRFNNPKKKKKVVSIDDNTSYTPLPTTFSRADLAKLQEEKDMVKAEIDAEYDENALDVESNEPVEEVRDSYRDLVVGRSVLEIEKEQAQRAAQEQEEQRLREQAEEQNASADDEDSEYDNDASIDADEDAEDAKNVDDGFPSDKLSVKPKINRNYFKHRGKK